jgi:hypothetical protein
MWNRFCYGKAGILFEGGARYYDSGMPLSMKVDEVVTSQTYKESPNRLS